eukprot:3730313-Lingulodinium_polyedra.AAC.1
MPAVPVTGLLGLTAARSAVLAPGRRQLAAAKQAGPTPGLWQLRAAWPPQAVGPNTDGLGKEGFLKPSMCCS